MTNKKSKNMGKKKSPPRHSNHQEHPPTFAAEIEEKVDENIFSVESGLQPSHVAVANDTSPSDHSISRDPSGGVANDTTTFSSPGLNTRKRTRHRGRTGSEGSYDVSLLGDFEPPGPSSSSGGWNHRHQDQAPPMMVAITAPSSGADESSIMGSVPHLSHATVEDICTRRLQEEHLDRGNHHHLRGIGNSKGFHASSATGGNGGSGHDDTAVKNPHHQKRGGRSQGLATHMLLENIGKKSTNCYLCTIMTTDNTKRTSIYSCVQCERGFHVNCFSLYHFQDEMAQHRPSLVQLMQVREESGKKKRRRRANTLTSNMKEFRVPFPL